MELIKEVHKESQKSYIGIVSLRAIVGVEVLIIVLGLCLVSLFGSITSGVITGNSAYGLGWVAILLTFAIEKFGGIFILFVIGILIYAFAIKKQKLGRNIAKTVTVLTVIISASMIFLFGFQYTTKLANQKQGQEHMQQYEAELRVAKPTY